MELQNQEQRKNNNFPERYQLTGGFIMLSIQELGKKLKEAGRLKLRPLCVYGTDEIPAGAVP